MSSNIRKPIDWGVSKRGIKYPIYAPIGEKFTLPSMTVPDQSIPIKELLKRFRRDGSEMIPGVYHGDDDIIPPNLERMEKTDLIDFARGNLQKISATQSKLDKRTAQQKEKDAKRAFEEAVAAEVERMKEVK